jgi:hypothetical protein
MAVQGGGCLNSKSSGDQDLAVGKEPAVGEQHRPMTASGAVMSPLAVNTLAFMSKLAISEQSAVLAVALNVSVSRSSVRAIDAMSQEGPHCLPPWVRRRTEVLLIVLIDSVARGAPGIVTRY